MPTCNICRENKGVEEMKKPYRYVCKKCWNKMIITIDNKIIDKELIY